MRKLIAQALLTAALLLPMSSTPGCATVLGTAVSPITGGVDLTRMYLSADLGGRGDWWWSPFVFLGGAISGPFVAIYNGVNHDISILNSWGSYWRELHRVFRPFEMIAGS